MPKLFQLVLLKNIIFFYVNQSNHLLTLTYLEGCFTPLNRLLADKKKYVSLSFWSPTTYIKIIKIGGGGDTWGTFLVSDLENCPFP